MKFKDKYTSVDQNEPGKTKITTEAYAVAELLEQILDKLEHLRQQWH